MKRGLLLFTFLVVVSFWGWGQIAAWDFNGNNTATATFAATTFNSNLVNSSGANNITRGSGAAASAANNSFRTTGFQNNGIALSNTDYFQITLTAASGYKVSLGTIDAKFGGTASFYASPGVTSQFAYSLDGTTFTLIGSPVQSTSLTMTQINLAGISALQNVVAGTTITLRYFASGQTTTGGWGFQSAATAGTNGLAIGGTVTTAISAPSITSPTSASVTNVSALLGGNITNDGGSAITDRGTVWKTTTGVTISDNFLSEGGTATGIFTHTRTGLPSATQIFYKAYATNLIGTALTSESSFYTLATEPLTHSTTFTNTVASQTQINLAFDAFSTITNASGYLILKKIGSAPTGLPADANAYTVGTAIGDATVAAIVTTSSATAANITGLTAGTAYYFTIVPFNNAANSATYNYKTDGTIPGTNGTTLAPLASTSEVSGPALGTQPNPALISSLLTTDAQAIRVFDMDVYDYGADGQPTKITQVSIKAGLNNNADWLATIQGVKLSLDGGSTFATIGTPAITASTIVIPVVAGNLNIPDATPKTLSLYIYLKNNGLTDNKILEFKVDATASSHGFTADATGSTFLPTFTTAPISNQILIDVVGTKFNFSTQPSNASVNTNFTAAVEALDANNNRDLDATSSVTLSASAGTLSSVTGLNKNLVSGLFSWSDLQNNATGIGVTLTATGTLTTATSAAFNIYSAQPTVQATGILFSNVTQTSMSVSWTSGDGANRIVVAKAITAPGVPTDG